MSNQEQETAMYDQPDEETMSDQEARVAEFKQRWAEADAKGMQGHRVEYALEPILTALEQSRPRVVETVEELDALPDKAVLRDAVGRVWEVKGELGEYRYNATDGGVYSASSSLFRAVPVTVLYTPDALGVRK